MNLGLQPGIYRDISEAVYHRDELCDRPTLSCSLAKVLIDQAPIHAWASHPRLGNKVSHESTAEQEYYQAVHALCLGKGAAIAICEEKNWQLKVAQEFRKEVRAEGGIPILRHKYDKAIEQRDALIRQLGEFGLLAPFTAAMPEVVVIYDDGSVRCRAMMDKVHIDEDRKRATIFDVKNCDSANPGGLGRTVFASHYDLQCVSYSNGLGLVRPDLAGRIDFIFLFIETEYPFCLTPYQLSGEQQMLGTSKWTRAWQMWEACTKANKWPSYCTEIVKGEAPKFGLAAEMSATPILPKE